MRLILTLLALLPLPALAQESVGRLNSAGFRTTEMCSAALVAPDLALTAAHCVAAPEDGYLKRVQDMVFVAGWDGAGHAGAARVASIEVHPQAFEGGRFRLAHDLALIRLATPLDLPVYAIGTAGPTGPLTILGYPRSAPHRVRVQEACPGARFGALWRIRCTVEKGQSGGPVLFGEGAAQRIVAVTVAQSGGDTLAVPVDGWLRRALARPPG